MIAFHHET